MGCELGEAVYWITRLQLQLQSLRNNVFQMMRPDYPDVSDLTSDLVFSLVFSDLNSDLVFSLAFSDLPSDLVFSVDLICSCFRGAPSLTRGRVCLWYVPLVLASAVFLGS
jgi:hypothetical protein